MFAVEAVIVSNGLRVTMSRPPSIRAHVLIAFKILLDCFPRPPVTTCERSIDALEAAFWALGAAASFEDAPLAGR